MQYKSFTTNLSNLSRYRKDKEDLKLKLEALETAEQGVGAIDYSKIPGSPNPSQMALKRLELVDKVDALQTELYFLEIAIIQVESTLSRMPEDLQGMLIDIFAKGKTYREVGLKHGFSDNGFWHYLKRETERYL